MTFSDFYLMPSRNAKVEILPGDKLIQRKDVIELGDQLTLVARPIGTDFAAKRVISEFLEEFQGRLENKSIQDALVETTRAFHHSLFHPPAEPELIPDSQCYLLMVYIDSQGHLSFIQAGDITFKIRRNRKFLALTKTNKSSLGGSLELKCHQMSDIQV